MSFAAAVPPDITLKFIGTGRPSSFPKLMYVLVVNPGYTPMNLAAMIAASELVVDGRSSRRTPAAFRGPAGLPPVSEWDGCLYAEDYAPPIPPGAHKVVLKMGGGQSAVVKMRWHEPVSWRKGNMKSRVKEVQDLGAALYDGLPRACAERWLTVKDGGTQEEDKVRYYLEPRIKMVVPYRQTFISGRERTIVDGTAKVYVEDLLTD